MATHSSIPAWRLPWTEEPGGLPSMGVTESGTRPSDYHFPFLSSILAWEIPGSLQHMES